MDMKRILPIILMMALTFPVLTSCDDFLDADSGRLVDSEQYDLKASADSLFSMFGLLTQMQKLADSYVLLGELRADLMEITDASDLSLREINNHSISADNPFADERKYYAVINNCNYILARLDTNLIDRGQRVQYRQYAAVQAIRAWTYLQMALNFKTVKYYEKPILTVKDAAGTFEELELPELANRLIALLEPLKEIPYPTPGFVDSYNLSFSLFPVKFVLGDLYLWTNQYEQAATAYRSLMFDQRIIIDKANYSYWIPVNNTISPNAYLYWIRSFNFGSGEIISSILCPTEYGQDFQLDSLNNQHRFQPTATAINNWAKQVYYLNEASNANGDLRRFGSLSYSEETNKAATTDYNFAGIKTSKPLIYKYKLYDQRVVVYRSALLYLRYAEAVNRLQKPNLAFAVLRSGLNSSTMFDEKVIPARERSNPLPEYMQFTDVRFQNNAGIRMRALGNADKDTTFYRIPALPGMMDSVRFVENLIQEELALETAFEGNRFHDLMRLTLRRMNDAGYASDESYLADKIAAKYPDAASARQRLMDRENWYIRK
jgi:starch-binding outer membrane protein, SusD/RagB family